MSIEYVTRGLTFDNLYVEVSVCRYICDICGRRECFHDVPTPCDVVVPTPKDRGWRLQVPVDDGEQGCVCSLCIAEDEARKARKSG